jgi:SAM-dependent methyltransferase
MDARATGLDPATFDLVCSNSTMEHIPAEDLDALMIECKRLLVPHGVMCFRIDYEDHYAIGDPAISPYNFLRFSDDEWRPYNNRLHFQNRLRHSDYVALFERAGLETITEEVLAPSHAARVELSTMSLAAQFRRYALDDLAIRKGTFVLRKQ